MSEKQNYVLELSPFELATLIDALNAAIANTIPIIYPHEKAERKALAAIKEALHKQALENP